MKNKKGEWLLVCSDDFMSIQPQYSCSVCRDIISTYYPPNECRKCGSINENKGNAIWVNVEIVEE